MKTETEAPRRKGPPILAFPDKCTGCLICELRCSLRFLREFEVSGSAIRVRRLVGAEREFNLIFTEKCDNCGLCARYCPYEALLWSKTAPRAVTAY